MKNLLILSLLVLFGLSDSFAQKFNKLPGGGIDIAVGYDGTAYVIGSTSKNIFKWNNYKRNWVRFGGKKIKGFRLTVDAKGFVWVLGENGQIYKSNPGYVSPVGEWELLPGKNIVDIGSGEDGTVWAANGNGSIYHWDYQKNSWNLFFKNTNFVSFSACGTFKNPWVLDSENKVQNYRSGWVPILPGAFKDVAHKNNQTVAVAFHSNQTIQSRNEPDNEWITYPNSPTDCLRIDLAPNGSIWVINKKFEIYAMKR